jgi:hypothetical protein
MPISTLLDRLAVELNGHVTVYDSLDHQISGVSQQQGSGGSLTFTSQYGTVSVSSLPIGLRCVDILDARMRMRMRGKHTHAVAHTGQNDIINVAPLTR